MGKFKLPRGQTSVEFLVLLGVAMVILTAVFIIAQGQTGDILKIKDQNDAKNSILDLSTAAKEVYAQGEGSRKQVFIRLPSSYEYVYSYVGNQTIKMRVAGTDYASYETFNVHGSLPAVAGGQWVWVVSEGNRVRIGNAMISLDKNWIYVTMNANTSSSASFVITNSWNSPINVSINSTWGATAVTMPPVNQKISLNQDGSGTVNLAFTANESAGGIYLGQIGLIADDGKGSSEALTVPLTVNVIPIGQQESLLDLRGPVVTMIYQDPTPAVKYSHLTIYANATDALTGNSTIKNCEITADGNNNWTTMLPVDGAYDEMTELTTNEFVDGFSLGPHTFQIQCTDFANNTGPTAYYFINVSETDTLGPIIVQLDHTGSPTTMTNITVTGIATEEYTGKAKITNCTVRMDSGQWNMATPDDGLWDEELEAFNYTIGTLPVGIHTAYARCADSLGNLGGIFNQTFGIVDVDLMLVLDRSGSMLENVTDAEDASIVSTTSSNYALVKTLTVTQKNGNLANLSIETKASTGCTAYYNATIGGITVANGSRTSTSYGTVTYLINISNYTVPYDIQLYMKRSAGGCTSYNQNFNLQQAPTKMNAVKTSAKSFLDVAGSSIQAGLVSYSTSATTDKTLALMNDANQQTLKNAIDALTPTGSTCIECGLDNAANELTSARARASANKVIVLLTDGISNVGNSVNGAVYCRNRNITVYTIGLGNNVNSTELTNIALLTNGQYYFAPDVETLNAIFQGIGKYG